MYEGGMKDVPWLDFSLLTCRHSGLSVQTHWRSLVREPLPNHLLAFQRLQKVYFLAGHGGHCYNINQLLMYVHVHTYVMYVGVRSPNYR